MFQVIASTVDGQTYKYLGIDQASGGYPYWTDHLRNARMFDADKPAELVHLRKELDEILLGKDQKMTDGTVRPNIMKQGALMLNNTNTVGKGFVVLFEVNLQQTASYMISGEIKKPSGFLYAEEENNDD